MVDRGEDTSQHFTGSGIFLRPGPNDRVRTEIEMHHAMVQNILTYAHEMKLEPQAAIERLISRALDEHSGGTARRKGATTPSIAPAEAA